MKKHLETQFQQIVEVLRERPLTMLQASQLTKIERAAVCRYIATLRKGDRVQVVRIGLCPITKHRAGFYTTNPLFYSKCSNQLSLFGGRENGK